MTWSIISLIEARQQPYYNHVSGSCLLNQSKMELLEERKLACKKAEENAKKVLKTGDRVRCTKCPGTKRVFTFSHWDGCWMVSKSGINDYHPINVDVVNGNAVNFQHEL